MTEEVPVLGGGGKGVILQKIPNDDRLVVAVSVEKRDTITVTIAKGKPRSIEVKALTIGSRAKRGVKVLQRITGVTGLQTELLPPVGPRNLTLL